MAFGFNDFEGIWRRSFLPVAAAILAVVLPASAQYPGQLSKPAGKEPVLRAISVLEWTGDLHHPKASRMVPVTVFDGNELQDGGIFLARPQPLSLAGEVEYELEQNGKRVGLFDIKNAGQEQGTWVGYGAWKAVPPAPKTKATKPLLPLNPSWDDPDGRPVLHRKHTAAESKPETGKPTKGTGGAAQTGEAEDTDRPTLQKKPEAGEAPAKAPVASDDPDRPTLHKKPASDDPATASDSGAADADRPTLHKKPDAAAGGGSSRPDEVDPDRPTLRKKSPAAASNDKPKKSKKKQDESSVEAFADSNDPDRPHLKRGKPEGAALAVLPSLMGLPADMKQAVAVSDAHSTLEHVWSFSWADPEDARKMKAELEEMARQALGLATPPAPAADAASAKAAKPAKGGRVRKAARANAVPESAEPAAPAPLLAEDFRIFELAYGSGATLVLTAHSGGEGAADKYIALVAQPNLYGNLVVLVKELTDAAHLDEKPRLLLVDAVDAEASNRGALLFELRGATERQFALYRVLRGQAERIFATAPLEIVQPTKNPSE